MRDHYNSLSKTTEPGWQGRCERQEKGGGCELTRKEKLLEELMQIEEETELHMEEENIARKEVIEMEKAKGTVNFF